MDKNKTLFCKNMEIVIFFLFYKFAKNQILLPIIKLPKTKKHSVTNK
jgi:hypothetical protein